MPRVFLIHLVFIFRYFGGRRADGTQAASGSAIRQAQAQAGSPWRRTAVAEAEPARGSRSGTYGQYTHADGRKTARDQPRSIYRDANRYKRAVPCAKADNDKRASSERERRDPTAPALSTSAHAALVIRP